MKEEIICQIRGLFLISRYSKLFLIEYLKCSNIYYNVIVCNHDSEIENNTLSIPYIKHLKSTYNSRVFDKQFVNIVYLYGTI